MKGVGNLKFTIDNTVDHSLMVGGRRAIGNFEASNTAAHTNMALIIGINPKDDRSSYRATLQNIKSTKQGPHDIPHTERGLTQCTYAYVCWIYKQRYYDDPQT